MRKNNKCLNLCEIHPICEDYNEIASIEKVTEEKYERIYLGSYFCSQYFKHMKISESFLSSLYKQGINVTLVLPVFSEKDLDEGKNILKRLIETGSRVIDEITINDFGQYEYCSRNYPAIGLNLGRLFCREPRDFRIRDLQKRRIHPSVLELPVKRLMPGIQRIEIDYISNCIIMDSPLQVDIHSPYVYQTTGTICPMASVTKNITEKFRPNIECALQCQHMDTSYIDGRVRRVGRTIFYREGNCISLADSASRIIYWPVDLCLSERYKNHEYISTAQ